MSIKKSLNLIQEFTEEQKREIDFLEKRIDAIIKLDYAGKTVRVINVKYPGDKVWGEIERRFTNNGWEIVYRKNSRKNGGWIKGEGWIELT